jgi:hypothetical protein
LIVRVGVLAALLDALGDLQNAVLYASSDGLWCCRNGASRRKQRGAPGFSIRGVVKLFGILRSIEDNARAG